MSTRVSYRDGGKTSEEGLLRFVSNSYSKSGVLDESALLVVQNGTPNNTVVVSAGDVIIGITEPTTGVSNYFYHGWVNSDTEIVTITNNISGNPRIDSIIAYINKSVQDTTNNDNPGVLTCVAVAGTPAASPVQPTDETIQAAVGVGNPWIILAQVAVANGFSTITTANITDARPKAATTPRFIDSFNDFVSSGSVPNTSSSLTTTLPKMEAFIGGYQISKPALAHLFTASKDTYVDISATVKPTGTDDYTYTEVTVGATAPSLAGGSIRLYKITSGASTITAVTDLRNTNVNSSTSANLTTPNIINHDGWISPNETWTYVSASTFTVPGDQTAKYSKSTRLMWTQTTVKYGVVISSSYSSVTTVTIATNTDYTIANAAITSNYYSYMANPQGYPCWFNWTPVWTSNANQPTIGNGTLTGAFSITSGTVNFRLRFTGGSTTTWGTGTYFITLPVAPWNGVAANDSIGMSGYAEDAGITPCRIEAGRMFDTVKMYVIISTATTVSNWAATFPFTWGTGDYWGVGGAYQIN